MNQELQDSVRFSDLAYTIKATLSHKITISNVHSAKSYIYDTVYILRMFENKLNIRLSTIFEK